MNHTDNLVLTHTLSLGTRLTRFLYNKNKIAHALTNSILSHDVDTSLFWAFELLCSGFETDVFHILGMIYSIHYESGNPKLLKYIHGVIDKWEQNTYPIEYVLIHVVLNLTCRECNPPTESPLKIHVPIEELPKYLEKYANVEPPAHIRPNKVLLVSCKYSLLIDDDVVDIDENDAVACYEKYISSNWLYYASKSPLWEKRIASYGGTINDTTCMVSFTNEENEEKFYEKYDYEPDEQPIDIQEKCLGIKLSNILTRFAK